MVRPKLWEMRESCLKILYRNLMSVLKASKPIASGAPRLLCTVVCVVMRMVVTGDCDGVVMVVIEGGSGDER